MNDEPSPESDYERLRAEHGQGLNDKQHGVVYFQAYQYGHSSGEEEVAGYYVELADMAREVLAAGQ